MTNGTGRAGTIRRTVSALVGVLTATTLLAGCGADGSGTGADAASPSPTATPREELLAAVPDGTEGAFRFAGKDSSSDISGVVDPAAKGMDLTAAVKDPEHGFTTRMSFLVVQEQLWMKVKFTGTEGLTGLPKLPSRWMELDRTKLTDAESAPTYEGVDVGNAGPIIEAATSVQEKADHTYTGVVDLTKGEASKAVGEAEVAALGEAARQVPFTAVVGPDGNLASLTVDVPAAGKAKAWTYVVKYVDYGSAPKLAAPTGNAAQQAPKVAYEMLNG
ncbi:hypothetical protein [Micromonospora sp. CV4]|uniref:hypothetical protein n=1 Tax=Micromonospora sp. CV4 TaxID=2478711 RepID=UPI000EF4577F|nr:hypothetical protein [Micromonospora sp. CV4]RLP92349.1 hypothetical protein EAD98_21720 [Micromonospora sp. CV4]RLP92380.1 hypothetical protein EAD98_21895 [Micromonospora sp. CV4]